MRRRYSFRLMVRLLGAVIWGTLRLTGKLLRTRLGLLMLLGAGLWLGVRSITGTALRVATFNIRDFGAQTDRVRLSALLRDTEADILALQELRDPQVLTQVAQDLSEKTSRHYQVAVSDCGGRRGLHLGFLYDADAVRLDALREFPELRTDQGGSCSQGDRAGLLGVFSARSGLRRVQTHLLTVHFPAGGDLPQIEKRQQLWDRAVQILGALRASGAERVMLLGDVNSTDYLEDRASERTAIARRLDAAKLSLLTEDLRCSAYWQPRAGGQLVPSVLDHVVASPELSVRSEPSPHGLCAQLGCEPTAQAPADFAAVSDHCPIVLTVR